MSTIKDLSNQTGIPLSTLYTRRKKGITGEALLAPAKRTGRPKQERDPELVKLAEDSNAPYPVLLKRKRAEWPTQMINTHVTRGRPNLLTLWQRTLKKTGLPR